MAIQAVTGEQEAKKGKERKRKEKKGKEKKRKARAAPTSPRESEHHQANILAACL
ncbi:hypothetical protein KKD52_11845 [Myxococcota bacterium]|nr:hypothetical protein [Myxococcota bacterium]